MSSVLCTATLGGTPSVPLFSYLKWLHDRRNLCKNSVGLNIFSDNEKFISCVTEGATFNNS